MRKTSFIMGLIGGIIGCLYSTILLAIYIEEAIGTAGAVFSIIMFFILGLIFIIGTSMVLIRGDIGGVLMIVSSVLLFALTIGSFFIESFQAGMESFFAIFLTLAIMGFISGILGYKSRNEPKIKLKTAGVYSNYALPQSVYTFCNSCRERLTPDAIFC